MRFLTWNAGGVRGSGPGQARADWLLSHLHSASDIAVLSIQETHCSNDAQLAQGIHDMSNRFSIFHSPATDGDNHSGILVAVSKEFVIEDQRILLEGRVMLIKTRSLVYENVMDVIVVYGYVCGRERWLHHIEDAVDVNVMIAIG